MLRQVEKIIPYEPFGNGAHIAGPDAGKAEEEIPVMRYYTAAIQHDNYYQAQAVKDEAQYLAYLYHGGIPVVSSAGLLQSHRTPSGYKSDTLNNSTTHAAII